MRKRSGSTTSPRSGQCISFSTTPDELHRYISDSDRSILARGEGGQPALARKLNTDLDRGRTDNLDMEAARIEIFGKNMLPPPHEDTFLDFLLEPLADTMMLLLIFCAVLSLILGFTLPNSETGKVDYGTCWIEGMAILTSVMIVSVVTAINNYQKELKFKELSTCGPPAKVNITIDGRVKEILETDLHVGDLLHIAEGMVLPVDAAVVKSCGLKMDESASTGESQEVKKSPESDFMLRSGSNIIEGEGIALVTGVGVHSFAGRITMECRKKKPDTPLQIKLEELADNIGKLGMLAAVIMFVVLSCMDIFAVFYMGSHPFNIKKYLDIITTSITIVVVAVPEGLPLSVTIALAYSMKQMFNENNLVRHLAACETMGGATTICTDKTGTLTMNDMMVMKAVLGNNHILTLEGNDTVDSVIIRKALNQPSSKELCCLLAESISLNSTAKKKRVPGETAGESPLRYVGNKTEQAMLKFLEKGGHDPMAIRASFEPTDLYSYPFTSSKMQMTTCVRLEGVMRYHVKGAPEKVLSSCKTQYSGDGIDVITPKRRAELTSLINEMARTRLRIIAVAYCDIDTPDHGLPFPENMDNSPPLCLLGIIGIEDPIRPEVAGSVAQCRSAGVSVRMVTGDSKATAISIARKAGIYGMVTTGPAKGEQGLAMEGSLFRELAQCESKLNQILPRLQVLSRASPTDKRILVNALMARNEVVAVTGDGTNDAPALKCANVGFAMNSGTDVAKNACDVVILDDNFKSIVTAMKWGRNVHDCISKFIQFQTTVNVAAVTIAFIGAIFSDNAESPLKSVQLLWLNLIMDTMAALALATEPPTDAILERPPVGRDAPLITSRMWLNILGQSLYQIIVQLWIIHVGFKWFDVPKDSETHMTIVFNVFVLMQVANEFNSRILNQRLNVFSGLSHTPMFLGVIAVTLIVQWVCVSHAGFFMHTVPISNDSWVKCLMISVVPLIIGFFLRLIPLEVKAVKEDTICCRRDENGEAIIETSMEEERRASKPKMTFQRAAYCVITQLNVVAAIAERQTMPRL
eukprot:Tbor_TRINITY_DN5840_c0_g1::TRINITY_DN5840_c0_g1_i5::g.5964::m.5964/K05850/ATP2B; Ca2+ transporting ATPase, plasma membrane